MEPADLQPLADALGYRFGDPALLDLALTHASFAGDEGVASNQRLEFLGDAVLGLVVVDHIVATHPELDEGTMTFVKTGVVSTAPLADAARSIGLEDHLKLGGQFKGRGLADSPSVLEDAFEALVGAIYLDGGLEAARSVVLALLGATIEAEAANPRRADAKSMLQERSVALGLGAPSFETVATSAVAHEPSFASTVTIAGRAVGQGIGGSKKAAEQAAAREALEGELGA